jgi:hypothetical protein
MKEDDANVFNKEHLGHNIHVTVEQGYERVDIRKWWLPEGAENIMATKKGVSLSLTMWQELKKNYPSTEEEVTKRTG